MKELYVVKEGKKLRCGYTTGSCSAAAAKAAVSMFINKKLINRVKIDTPANIVLELEVMKPVIKEDYAECCIVKDSGDDPDVTDGIEIYARISKRKDNLITIDGGEGIGRIKRKGLFGEIGEAAINPVPRRMIEEEVRKVTEEGFDIVIYAPMGKLISEKTFNKNIGIEGGISIIGTTGIVEPMSEKALLDTIYLEIDTVYNEGLREIILYPGNYGEKMLESLKLTGRKVKISNYVGDAVLYSVYKGFKSITLLGHIGKFSKISVGAFNTHSKVCDVRMEAFVYYLALRGAKLELLEKVKNCITTEEALELVYENGFKIAIEDMKKGIEARIRKYIKNDEVKVKIYMYSMKYGVL
ncbi:cobalt-precorrin-5B (C(1))-methyltransferase CbiD [Clostridium hydrogenum]|uniref:cobalt-precorrin-5B (C(1))-methyltransferase CbiD n=1 Tax=Clostridium hydrogenum TaxID=2855764 RepID=UPI001EEEB7EB|nr:cobalt-precorrin-5B (C(1))-methyltransferase CbiD [Clostridium hydrogenum]